MKYLPFERISYNTKLPEQEVLRRLSNCVEPKRFGFRKVSDKEYEGDINDNSFDISKIIQYRNSFIPQIKGTIQKNNQGTQIEVTMQLHVFVFVFLIFWCSFALLFFIGIGIRDIENRKISVELLIPFFMLLFVYALATIGFKIESNSAKDDFKKRFEAEIIKE